MLQHELRIRRAQHAFSVEDDDRMRRQCPLTAFRFHRVRMPFRLGWPEQVCGPLSTFQRGNVNKDNRFAGDLGSMAIRMFAIRDLRPNKI